MKICGYKDFGFRDLSAPNGKRFRRQLSACINFLKYQVNKIHLLNTQLDEVSDGGFHNKGHLFPFQSDPIFISSMFESSKNHSLLLHLAIWYVCSSRRIG